MTDVLWQKDLNIFLQGNSKSSLFNYFITSRMSHTHRGYGVDHAVGDLVLPHVLHHVKLSRSLLGNDLVSDFLQLGVELLEEIFKQQRQQLEKAEREKGRALLIKNTFDRYESVVKSPS